MGLVLNAITCLLLQGMEPPPEAQRTRLPLARPFISRPLCLQWISPTTPSELE